MPRCASIIEGVRGVVGLCLLVAVCNPSRAYRGEESVALFNGKDLAGWTVHIDPKDRGTARTPIRTTSSPSGTAFFASRANSSAD